MGNSRSQRQPHGSENDRDLLPIDIIGRKEFLFQNLTFQDGRARAYAYIGALKVLEKVNILPNVKRVCGVGTGAIVASLLACKLPCDEIQHILFHLLDELVVDDPPTYQDYKPRLVNELGWNPGNKLYEMLGDIFAKKYNNPDLTFMQLHDQTYVEFCVVVTNVNSMRAEYWHKKTTPDMIVREALYMSLSLPGIFRPRLSSKYSSEDTQSVYLTGSLLCSNPIHAYDGWWLSVDPCNDFFMRWSYVPQSTTDKEKFNYWNSKSLGFVLLNKRDEKIYPGFADRLSKAGVTDSIPDTEAGKNYKRSLQLHKQTEVIYDTVHEATKKILEMIDLCVRDYDFAESLAEKIVDKNSPLTKREQLLLFSRCPTNVKDCLEAFKHISPRSSLTPTKLLAHIQRIAFSILDDYTFRIAEEVNNMTSFFDKVTQTMNMNTNKIHENDQKRIVGIFYGHVSTNTLLEPGDQTYLFRQGWNSTVAYLSQLEIIDLARIAWKINSGLDN